MESASRTARQGKFEIVAESEIPFPPSLAPGEGTPLLVGGWCRSTVGSPSIKKIEISVDGYRSKPMSFGLPRKDVYRQALAEGAEPDQAMAAFKSGFAAIAEVPAGAAGRTVPVEVIGISPSGDEASAPLGELALMSNPEPGEEVPWQEGEAGPRIAICMATYSPDPTKFSRQIDSLKAQTHRNWFCLISDDQSSPESLELIGRTIGGDPRFKISPASGRLGFYSNFERALEMVPDSAELIALSDQDDRWEPDKLSALIQAVSPEGTTLAYSNSRVVAEDGRVIHPSYWSLGRHNNHANLGSLIVANTITGAASIFKPEVLRLALPFPHTPVNCFHDHWIACVALALGKIAYVDRPLYDYVQHEEAVIGFDQAQSGLNAGRSRPISSFRATLRDTASSDSIDPAEATAIRLSTPAMDYYFGSTRMSVLAAALRMRCGDHLTGAKRRMVDRLETVDQNSLSFAYLLARRFRRFVGRNETTDIERTRAKGLLWRRGIQLRARFEKDPDRIVNDARVPVLQEALPGEAARL